MSEERPKQTLKEWVEELSGKGLNVDYVEGDPSETTIMFIGEPAEASGDEPAGEPEPER